MGLGTPGANHLATTTKDDDSSIQSTGDDNFRAKSAVGRIVIGADDALERMRTVVGRRHFLTVGSIRSTATTPYRAARIKPAISMDQRINTTRRERGGLITCWEGSVAHQFSLRRQNGGWMAGYIHVPFCFDNATF